MPGRRFRSSGPGPFDGAWPGVLLPALRRLERDGLVERTVYTTVPAQVEYALTPMGHSLTFVLGAVVDWAAEHRDDVMVSRTRWDADNPDSTVR
ncbi:winged helix-turn-helix transcriptional regulator [Nocardia sp. GCM10030253]